MISFANLGSFHLTVKTHCVERAEWMAPELEFLYVPRRDAVKRAEIGLYNDACQDRTVTLN